MAISSHLNAGRHSRNHNNMYPRPYRYRPSTISAPSSKSNSMRISKPPAVTADHHHGSITLEQRIMDGRQEQRDRCDTVKTNGRERTQEIQMPRYVNKYGYDAPTRLPTAGRQQRGPIYPRYKSSHEIHTYGREVNTLSRSTTHLGNGTVCQTTSCLVGNGVETSQQPRSSRSRLPSFDRDHVSDSEANYATDPDTDDDPYDAALSGEDYISDNSNEDAMTGTQDKPVDTRGENMRGEEGATEHEASSITRVHGAPNQHVFPGHDGETRRTFIFDLTSSSPSPTGSSLSNGAMRPAETLYSYPMPAPSGKSVHSRGVKHYASEMTDGDRQAKKPNIIGNRHTNNDPVVIPKAGLTTTAGPHAGDFSTVHATAPGDQLFNASSVGVNASNDFVNETRRRLTVLEARQGIRTRLAKAEYDDMKRRVSLVEDKLKKITEVHTGLAGSILASSTSVADLNVDTRHCDVRLPKLNERSYQDASAMNNGGPADAPSDYSHALHGVQSPDYRVMSLQESSHRYQNDNHLATSSSITRANRSEANATRVVRPWATVPPPSKDAATSTGFARPSDSASYEPTSATRPTAAHTSAASLPTVNANSESQPGNRAQIPGASPNQKPNGRMRATFSTNDAFFSRHTLSDRIAKPEVGNVVQGEVCPEYDSSGVLRLLVVSKDRVPLAWLHGGDEHIIRDWISRGSIIRITLIWARHVMTNASWYNRVYLYEAGASWRAVE